MRLRPPRPQLCDDHVHERRAAMRGPRRVSKFPNAGDKLVRRRTMRRTKKSSRRPLRFERLEPRAMLSGTVTYVGSYNPAVPSPLQLTGDNSSNIVTVHQVGT